ncbi:hypothetical protein ACJX0J_024304 [Zea mays]
MRFFLLLAGIDVAFGLGPLSIQGTIFNILLGANPPYTNQYQIVAAWTPAGLFIYNSHWHTVCFLTLNGEPIFTCIYMCLFFFTKAIVIKFAAYFSMSTIFFF